MSLANVCEAMLPGAERGESPEPPAEWAPLYRQLRQAAQAAERPPAWWTPDTGYHANIETRADPSEYHWDGMKRRGDPAHSQIYFQFTLAGFGHYEAYGQPPQRLTPGTGFLAVVPSRHRYYLPEHSPGWTFFWIGLRHPYVVRRCIERIRATGPIVSPPRDSVFLAKAVRLVEGVFRKDFRDQFAVEQAHFEFLVEYERFAHQAAYPQEGRERLLAESRRWIGARLKQAVSVEMLATRHGMSRSHFSHFFKARTGLSPARFLTEVRVQEAARMLVQTAAPLKEIASACGFADANHFCKVFRRFHHLSPGAYRQQMR